MDVFSVYSETLDFGMCGYSVGPRVEFMVCIAGVCVFAGCLFDVSW